MADDAPIVPATPEEYRAMLDGLGLYTRETEKGFDAFYLSGARMIPLKFWRDKNGWWDVVSDDGEHTRMWCSAYASEDTQNYIRDYLRIR